MTKRHKMTVEIPVTFHEKLKDIAGKAGMTLSGYVKQSLSGDVYYFYEKVDQLTASNKALAKAQARVVLWRVLAVAFFVGLLVLCFLYGSLESAYLDLHKDGVQPFHPSVYELLL